MDPALALTLFGVATLVLAAFAWPRTGLFARFSSAILMTEKVRIEDALKYLHEQEYLGKSSSVAGLAGTLQMPRGRTVRLVARMGSLELVRSDGGGFLLTDSGRAYARRIIRGHRLWERYLADRTSVKPTDWHDEAELREHSLTAEAVDELSARMGHPRYDPHGDPIPTSSGELPPPSGVALSTLSPGQCGTILHVEDEPREVYVRLVAMGLAPLMEIEVLEVSPSRIRFTADDDELAMEPVVANNVTIKPMDSRTPGEKPSSTLADLEQGKTAVVVRISPSCRGPQRRRLLDLGVVPGTVIEAELEGALSDPIAYRIRGSLIALRKAQAKQIFVTPAA
jgi:DtxR family Mn-dependent transcriptional regulator